MLSLAPSMMNIGESRTQTRGLEAIRWLDGDTFTYGLPLETHVDHIRCQCANISLITFSYALSPRSLFLLYLFRHFHIELDPHIYLERIYLCRVTRTTEHKIWGLSFPSSMFSFFFFLTSCEPFVFFSYRYCCSGLC